MLIRMINSPITILDILNDKLCIFRENFMSVPYKAYSNYSVLKSYLSILEILARSIKTFFIFSRERHNILGAYAV